MKQAAAPRSGGKVALGYSMGVSALALSAVLAAPPSAQATPCGTLTGSGGLSAGVNCTGFVWNGSSGGSFTNQGTIVGSGTDPSITGGIAFHVIGNSLTALLNGVPGSVGTIGGLTGVTGGFAALEFDGTPTINTVSGTLTYTIGAHPIVDTVLNDVGSQILGNGPAGAIRIDDGSAIGTLTNNGTIQSSNNSAINQLGGSIGVLTNSGLIYNSGNGGAIDVDVIETISTISTLVNTGTILAVASDALNVFGKIGTLTNSGTISSGSGGHGFLVENYRAFGAAGQSHVGADATIATLTNSGVISAAAAAFSAISIGPGGSIIGLTNTSIGTIQGGSSAPAIAIAATTGNPSVTNPGYLGRLTNAGLIVGGIVNSGALGTIANTGVIQGDITNNTASDLTITGGASGTVGTLAGRTGGVGTITNTLSNVVLGAGSLLLDDDVNAGGNLLYNTQNTLTIGTIVTVTGGYLQNNINASLNLATGAMLVVTGAATISDGSVIAGFDPTLNHLVNDSITLVQGGAGSSYATINAFNNPLVESGVPGLLVTRDVSGDNLLAVVTNDYIGAVTSTFTNNAAISATSAIYVAPSGTVGTLTNTGTLNGLGLFGIRLSSTTSVQIASIGTLSNSGLIEGQVGLYNGGDIGVINNTGTILDSVPNSGIFNRGTIGLINNETLGTIAGTDGIVNSGLINTILNAGLIRGSMSGATTAIGIASYASIATLTNSGTIAGINSAGLAVGVLSYGSIGALTNTIGGTISAAGTISSGSLNVIAGVENQGGSIATLSNSGLITAGADSTISIGAGSGSTLYNAVAGIANIGGVIDVLSNSGTLSATGTLHDFANGRNSGVFNTGHIGTLLNNAGGLIESANDYAINNFLGGTIGALTNNGTISSDNRTGIYNQGSIGVLTNNGQITGGVTGVWSSSGSIGTIINTGTINGDVEAVTTNAGAMIGTLNNSGMISSASSGIDNFGSIGTLINSGTIQAPTAIRIGSGGSLGVVSNSGLIAGSILNSSTNILTINGGTGTLVGTLTGGSGGIGSADKGSINNTLSNVSFGPGALLLNDNIRATGHTVLNSGAKLSLLNTISITGGYGQASGTLALANGAQLVVSGVASISGGTVTTGAYVSGGDYTAGSSTTLVAGGASSTYTASVVRSSITGLGVTGSVSGNNLLAVLANDYVGGSLATLTNSGSLVYGSLGAVYVAASGTLGSLANSGTLQGAGAVVVAGGGHLGTVSNTGLIQNSLAGAIYSTVGGVIGEIDNSITGTLGSTSLAAINDLGASIGTVNNAGLIINTGGGIDVYNVGAITRFNNTGTITNSGVAFGAIYNGVTGTLVGTIGTLSNSGLITNTSTIGSGTVAAIFVNAGSVGAILNAGTISGRTAIRVGAAGTIGSIVNSGSIIGGVLNQSTAALTLNGGLSLYGAYTGQAGARGTITSTGANVVLASGDVLLNDNVNVTGHTLVNSGASVQLNSILNVTGNYGQSAGTLLTGLGGAGNGELLVSGTAAFTGGTVAVTANSGANLLAGQSYTIVEAGALSTSNLTASALGFSATLGSAANGGLTDLLLTLASDYVSGSLGTLTNSGSISAVTAVNITSAGSLGTLVNTGAINGGVLNGGAHDLVIVGGTGGVVGSFSGGTISNIGANLIFASGAVSLADAINVTGHTVSNTGATLNLASGVSVTGAYSQTGGLLNLGGHLLTVSGPALFGGGSISAGLSAAGNYFVGDSITLIQGGAGSSYTGASVASGLTGLSATGSVSGNTLLALAANDYIGTSFGTLSVGGTLSAANALYIASTGNLAGLTNTGAIIGNVVNNSAHNLIITGGAGGVVGTFTGGTISNTSANLVLTSGDILLNDSVNVTGHTLVNTGATLHLTSIVNVTGDYGQSGGALLIGVGGGSTGELLVSGAAAFSGGTVGVGALAGANLLAGQSYTIVEAGSLSTSNLTAAASGFSATLASAAHGGLTDLLLTLASDYVSGALGTLTNSGSISAVTAVNITSSGSLGTLVNSGAISGGVVNNSTHDLVIVGGVGGVVGSFSGGTISNTGANLIFVSGAVSLADAINVTGHTVSNIGATLDLASGVSVTGAYSQTSGLLNLNGHLLTVSGPAVFSGGAVSAGLSATGNYFVGDSITLIQGGAGSSYTGASVSSGLTGLSATGSVSGNTLLALAANDYIGTNFGALTIGGALSAATALYIASTGDLAGLTNTGVITGNVINNSAHDLIITGGSGGVVGAFTGGTITNTGANLVFASGAISLADAINVGAQTVINSGATIDLAADTPITGGYTQTDGLLNLNGHLLSVSGPAVVSGGVVSADLAAIGNYFVGDSVTLIQGGAGSSYTGASVSSGLTGLSATGSVSGNNLLALAANDYIGTNFGALTIGGALSAATALYIASTGDLAGLTNTGVITGNVINNSAHDLIITGGAGGVVGAFTGGTITNTGANLVFASGAISLADAINVGAQTVINSGAAINLAADTPITGGYNQTDGLLNLNGHLLTVSGPALVTGGAISAGLSGIGNYFVGDSITLIQGGAGSSYTGASISSGLTGLSATGSVSGNNLLALAANDYIGTSFGPLTIGGALSAATALYIASTGDLAGLTNTGVITGNVINNSAHDLIITGGAGGVIGTFTGGTITNTGANLVLASGDILLNDNVNVGGQTLVNSGAVIHLTSIVNLTGNYGQSGGALIVDVGAGSTGELLVSGAAAFTGGTVGVAALAGANLLAGQSYTIVEAGSLSTSNLTASASGFSATLGSVANGGLTDLLLTLASDYVSGALGTLTNSGSISAATAINITSTGSLGTLVNTGAINGGVINSSANDLVIIGGAGGVIGSFSGGTISNTGADLIFASGAISLADAIDVTGHTARNIGASLILAADTPITGAYSQTSGLLNLNGHLLTVSGAAVVSGGVVSAGLASIGNYFVGDSVTLIQGGAGSSYTGAVISSGLTGLSATGSTSGNNLLALAANDYIGASFGTLTNALSFSSDYGLYIASTGVLGGLSNSGTIAGAIAAIHNDGAIGAIVNTGVIAGDIDNTSATDLTISGGAGGVFGTLTGFAAGTTGVINNLFSNVNLVSGQVLLNDDVNLGSHSLINSGATIAVNTALHITGNYRQTSGGLLIGVTSTASYGKLLVSGSADLTGGSVTLVRLGTGTIAAGQAYTVVEAGGGVTFSNLTGSATGLTGAFSTAANGSATDLVLTLSGTATPPPATTFTGTGITAGGSAAGTGAALDQIADAGGPAATPVINNVLLPLAVLPQQQQERAITQLAPSQLTPQVIAVAISPALNAIVQHQDTLAANMSGREERGMAAGSAQEPNAVWGQLLVNTAARDNVTGASPYRADSLGLMFGADLFGTPNLVFGAALSWVTSVADGRGAVTGSRTNLDSYQATGYFTWQPNGANAAGLVVDGQVGFGINHFDQRRRIDFLGADAHASYGGKQYLVNLRASYAMPVGKTATITPFASLREVHLYNDGYGETGAGPADLQVRHLNADSLNHEIGLQAATQLETQWGQVSPMLKAGWVHNYTNGPIPLTAVLGGVTFVSDAARGARDGAVVGAGLSLIKSDQLKISVQYDGELRSDFQSHSGVVKVTYNF